MAKHGVATISTSTVGAGVRTCAADLPCARHQCVFDAAMAPAQESGLRENCTSRLSERAEAGRTLDLSRLYSNEAGEQRRSHCGGVCGGDAAESVERRAGAKGNTHQHNTYWTQSQARVTNALERIRPLSPSHTRGGSRMRESRTYGSVRGACDETHVPTATAARVHIAARRRGGGVATRRASRAGERSERPARRLQSAAA